MLLTADRIVTMDPQRRVLEDGWILLDGPVITDIGQGAAPAHDGEHRHGDLVMPGLVSAHQHIVDALLRGVPPGHQFLDWLIGVYYTGLSHATPEECGLITELVMSEMLRSGVTTVVDCWGVDGGDPDRGRVTACAEASIRAHVRSGARVLFAHMFAEQVPDEWRAVPGTFDVDRICAPAEVTFDRVADLVALHVRSPSSLVQVTPMPELPELVSDEAFRGAFALAQGLGVVLPVHLCASPSSRARCGPEDLDRLGVLGPGLLGAHCISIDGRDVQALARARVGIAHCPTANQVFPGGTTPVVALRAAGASVGVGLDNASLQPRVDLLGEARAAVLAARSSGGELSSGDALAMATCESAAAIGLSDRIGSIQVGKRADLVLLDTSGPHWVPDAEPMSAVLWQSRVDDVRTVLVDGTVVVDGGECLTSSPDLAATSRAARRVRGQLGRPH